MRQNKMTKKAKKREKLVNLVICFKMIEFYLKRDE